ncbi:type I-C CRISPR-associated endonuclease Cas1c [Verrucomicrobium sp. 3C]|uniref:type I-C CRISPR-associated endonuclease Cas1c n=1 Tax=Verrucomicrobium sp. 3C TaxID=1134055 RepID=UPI00036A6D4B|nr:type I-C CRISPR-associated endonuclease Cas1c [Verrucomicrobium sp. 3C]
MKKLLNTVYVTTDGASLRKEGENLVAEVDGAERARVPFHMLASIVTFGSICVSPALMAATAAAGITLVFLDRNGRFQARLEGPVTGNVLLRLSQYRGLDAPTNIACSIVIGKMMNQRSVLMRCLRDYGDDYVEADRRAIAAVIERMAQSIRRAELSDNSLDLLRGFEGEAANLYFSVFDHLIRSPDTELRWTGRSRRPPLDPINALLSFLYTLLTHDCRSACESVGLDPAVGFLHRVRPGRPSLALDLMEELRPVMADRLALSLINRRQLRAKDFETRDGGVVLLSDDARRTVLTAWQERKKEERLHPFLDEKVPLGLVPYLQAQMLARHLRGDLDAYPPYFWK